ncbi:tripartite tricarboxylate transporter substrate binding protein [Roseomonas sp. NAR14]|uniref:Tripartite tricarboxylate transporter substrate binding protein n=1 Tax=Roseomonas acroporae TaxID=2937791 RepID=A0A9X1YBJ9_9PROT|nr:tripartite tricarboxylate transporter substrate binding protein [Roseomonas acroporae]MCK8787759.1 tripartite tricarboxylate transporter substrate binding protein [Roseomonas acroporae]
MLNRRQLILGASTLLGGTALGAPALRAQPWPQRNVSLIVPFAPGGVTDIMARLAAERLSDGLGKPVVVENLSGGSGAIAAERALRGRGDGSTLFFATITQLCVLPFLQRIPYDPADFAPVAAVFSTPFLVTVRADSPYGDFAALLAAARRAPGKITYGSAGQGSLSHLASALIAQRGGLDMVHVPYRGEAPAFADLLAGTVDFITGSPVQVLPAVQAGQLRILATTGATRARQAPQAPVVAETFPGYAAATWNGVTVARGAPVDIDRMSNILRAAARDPAFVAQLARQGVDPVDLSPEAFGQLIAADTDRWRETIGQLGLSVG